MTSGTNHWLDISGGGLNLNEKNLGECAVVTLMMTLLVQARLFL